MIDDTYVVGKIKLSGKHPFIEHYEFLKQFEDENTVAKLDHTCTGSVFRTDDYAICMGKYFKVL